MLIEEFDLFMVHSLVCKQASLVFEGLPTVRAGEWSLSCVSAPMHSELWRLFEAHAADGAGIRLFSSMYSEVYPNLCSPAELEKN